MTYRPAMRGCSGEGLSGSGSGLCLRVLAVPSLTQRPQRNCLWKARVPHVELQLDRLRMSSVSCPVLDLQRWASKPLTICVTTD